MTKIPLRVRTKQGVLIWGFWSNFTFGLKWQQNANLRDPDLKILDFGLKWQN
ncbi:hypothetical protein HanRHA438_Chr14g0680141 [Helianthus annuus]|nr:hypothetical protein HanRHA438_Chr14g0680141 [Helianthus annuus]